MVPELARYLIEAGGKRLRPMLTRGARRPVRRRRRQRRSITPPPSSSCTTPRCCTTTSSTRATCGAAGRRRAWSGATRRACWSAISCSGQAFLMMVETGDLEALGVLSRAATVIAEGEVFQLAKARDLDDDPRRLRRSHPRQDRDAVRGGDRGRAPWRAAPTRPAQRRCAALRPRTRLGLPAGRRRARLSRRERRAGQEHRRRSARRQDDAAGHPDAGRRQRRRAGDDHRRRSASPMPTPGRWPASLPSWSGTAPSNRPSAQARDHADAPARPRSAPGLADARSARRNRRVLRVAGLLGSVPRLTQWHRRSKRY